MIRFQTKVKAGALQFAILISVVIALIISAFLLHTYTQQQFARQVEWSAQSMKLSTSGFSLISQKEIPYNDSIRFNPEQSNREAITLFKSHWGIYDKLVSIGQAKNLTSKKIGIIGGQTSKKDRVAVYLEDTNSPLVVVGNTTINGNAVLPRQGIRPGVISGNYFNGTTLVNGSTAKISSKKPSLSTEKLDYIKSLVFGPIPTQDSLFIHSFNDKVSSSFEAEAKWLYSPNIITIGDQSIRNNIIIKSDTLIRISAFAKAENVILVAPYIEIADSASGTFQVFASKAISIGKNVSLAYPSALALVQDETTKQGESTDLEGINVGQQSVISGSILHLDFSGTSYQRAMIKLAENSMVRGEVYSDQTVELKGTLKGSVFTHQFEIAAKGSVYKNHLYNTTIDGMDFPESFCGIQTGMTTTSLVQWVY